MSFEWINREGKLITISRYSSVTGMLAWTTRQINQAMSITIPYIYVYMYIFLSNWCCLWLLLNCNLTVVTCLFQHDENNCEKYSWINIINIKHDKLPLETFPTIPMQMKKPEESIWFVIISHNPRVTTLPPIKTNPLSILIIAWFSNNSN